MEKFYKIYYGEEKNDYIKRYLKDDEIINGYLTEAKAFNIFYSDMILCNNYFNNNNNINNIDMLTNNNDDEYMEEYQLFIINPEYDENVTTKATEKMGNTLYHDDNMDLYLTGVSDFGTSRTIVSTQLKVEEVKGVK